MCSGVFSFPSFVHSASFCFFFVLAILGFRLPLSLLLVCKTRLVAGAAGRVAGERGRGRQAAGRCAQEPRSPARRARGRPTAPYCRRRLAQPAARGPRPPRRRRRRRGSRGRALGVKTAAAASLPAAVSAAPRAAVVSAAPARASRRRRVASSPGGARGAGARAGQPAAEATCRRLGRSCCVAAACEPPSRWKGRRLSLAGRGDRRRRGHGAEHRTVCSAHVSRGVPPQPPPLRRTTAEPPSRRVT